MCPSARGDGWRTAVQDVKPPRVPPNTVGSVNGARSEQPRGEPDDAAPAQDTVDAPAADVASRTVRGMFWAYGAYVGGRALVLVSTAVLARVLTPSDFGLVALALVFMTFLDTVRDLGLTQALIGTARDELEEQTQTVFVGTVVIGGLLALFAVALGPIAAGVLGQEKVAAIIPVLAGNFFLQSLGATHGALATKALDYRARTIAEGADVVVRGALSIGLALAGAGVWSLVVGYVVGTLARDVALWAQVPWRPSFSFPRTHLRRLVRFGGILTLVDIASAVGSNLAYLFVGGVLGATSLGIYTIGFRLPELLILNLAIVAGDVLFPAYAALDRSRLHEGFLVSLRYIAALVLPMSVGLVVLARPTVLTLFGDKFEGSIDIMRLLAVYAACAAINIPAGTIYKVMGRGGILLYTGLPYVAVLAATLAIVTGRGIVAVALAVVACQAILASVSLVVASRILQVGPRRLWDAVKAPVLASAAMGLAVLPVERLIDAPVAALALGIVVGVGVYLAAVHLLDRDLMDRFRGTVSPGRLAVPRAES